MPEGMNLSWNGRDGEVLDSGYGDWFAQALEDDRRRKVNPQQFSGTPVRDDAHTLAQTEILSDQGPYAHLPYDERSAAAAANRR